MSLEKEGGGPAREGDADMRESGRVEGKVREGVGGEHISIDLTSRGSNNR